MSVLLWWVPAIVVVALAWWRMRAKSSIRTDADLRRLGEIVRGDQ